MFPVSCHNDGSSRTLCDGHVSHWHQNLKTSPQNDSKFSLIDRLVSSHIWLGELRGIVGPLHPFRLNPFPILVSNGQNII